MDAIQLEALVELVQAPCQGAEGCGEYHDEDLMILLNGPTRVCTNMVCRFLCSYKGYLSLAGKPSAFHGVNLTKLTQRDGLGKWLIHARGSNRDFPMEVILF